MSRPVNPSEITRDVLRLLATRRLQPTPEHFSRLYHEIAGTPEGAERLPPRILHAIAERLPRDTSDRVRAARQLDQALAGGDTETAERLLMARLDDLHEDDAPAWNTLIGALVRQWDGRQLGWTIARKRESLDRVLAANDPSTLYGRLQGLVRAWNQTPVDPERPAEGAVADTSPSGIVEASPTVREATFVTAADAGEIIVTLRDLLLVALETVVPAFMAEHPELIREAASLANSVRLSETADQLRTIGIQLRKYAYRLELTAGDDAELQAGLVRLLRLLLENIEEIAIDDQWLHGQVEMLRDIVDKPASLRLLDDAERRLKEVIFKQSQLKHNLVQARRNLQELLAGFVDQLASFTEHTSAYHDKIAVNAAKIAGAGSIEEIGHLLDDVMRETRLIQQEASRSREDLQNARDRARAAERKIVELQHELEQTSSQMRHDQLTGALNRRGLEEVFDKEAARALRRSAGLCVALLDIDNFKRLNDTYGHKTGDDALVHLIRVIGENLRPNDTVARLGGEEFIILYPESDLTRATAALVRLQRALTRTFFLADESKILITFSAGASAWLPGESMDAVIERADAAMYEAKQTGKNKVVAR